MGDKNSKEQLQQMAKEKSGLDVSEVDLYEIISALCDEVTKKEARIKLLTKQNKFLRRVVEHGDFFPEKTRILAETNPEDLQVGRDDEAIQDLINSWNR